MNKWIGGLIIAVIILAGGAVFVFKGNTSPEKPSSSTSSTSTPSDQTSSTSVNVEIKDFAFNPATLKIKKGTKVTWTNQDATKQNAV